MSGMTSTSKHFENLAYAAKLELVLYVQYFAAYNQDKILSKHIFPN